MLDIQERTVETDPADGTASLLTDKFLGRVIAIQYVKDDYANGVDFTITGNISGQTIWTQVDVDASVVVYPRTQVHSTAGVGLTYDATQKVSEPPLLIDEQIKIAIAQGGNSKKGKFIFVIDV